ncbi:hypothetical protein [Nocardia caishijiensis]|uniref:DNA-directed RNA polymerase specialized sigma24 family protein n=1 Tax=Nocardia caishijiensis TaxID=184756 RepID=A0ABQ6YQU1_9NOCA|nr:hypothetical protein [Nocardia caishijiensis]KAF0848139.1 DNA-directed RNA polymerase specialized sigma24 family protein [Nocardia caishijiensis]
MTDEGTASDWKQVLGELFGEGFLVGLIAQLHSHYPTAASAEIEDAVCEAAVKLVEQLSAGKPIRNVRSYFAKVAYRALTRFKGGLAKREVRLPELQLPEDYRPASTAPSAEDEAVAREQHVLRRRAVNAMKLEIRSWTNANIREVMLVVIEAAEAGELIEADEITRIVSQNLGEEVSVPTVRVWKQRGFERIRTFLNNHMRELVGQVELAGNREMTSNREK